MDMEVDDLKAGQFINCPPLMPWRQFAVWIGMEDKQQHVRGWCDKGYLPTVRMGRHRMVNVALVVKQLLEQEDF
ncbi:DNA-binding protein [Pseudomonas sp. BN515]|uniref:DNA-binding protein n=1 Tax=Pseudomonas sp. BN515 TaxID=2567892 RepID=UPI0032AF4C62